MSKNLRAPPQISAQGTTLKQKGRKQPRQPNKAYKGRSNSVEVGSINRGEGERVNISIDANNRESQPTSVAVIKKNRSISYINH